MLAMLAAAALAAQQPSATDLYRPSPGCSVDVDAMLKLSPYDFDQTEKGWRSVSANVGCEVAAANLIATYRRENWGKLDQNELQISFWHEGQARASGHETELAIPLMLAGVNPGVAGVSGNMDQETTRIGMANAEYALATVAFLQHDLVALKAARARLAALPEPSMWPTMLEKMPTPLKASGSWPPNLNIVDGLIRCFGKSYSEAYACDAIAAAKRARAH